MSSKAVHVLANRDIKAFENAYLDLCRKYNLYFGRDLIVYELPTINVFERSVLLARIVKIIKDANRGANGL